MYNIPKDAAFWWQKCKVTYWGGFSIKSFIINRYLEKIKLHITTKGFKFIGGRDKNAKFMEQYGFEIEDIKEIILDLNDSHHIDGPSEDYNPSYDGDVWEFVYRLDLDSNAGIDIYIKIRYNPPDELVCISFHD